MGLFCWRPTVVIYLELITFLHELYVLRPPAIYIHLLEASIEMFWIIEKFEQTDLEILLNENLKQNTHTKTIYSGYLTEKSLGEMLFEIEKHFQGTRPA